MIFGIGIDNVQISRIKDILNKRQNLGKVFGDDELQALTDGKKKAQSAAGWFCAKEAFAKALGTGIRGFSLNEVQVVYDDLGKPGYKLTGNAKNITENHKIKLHLSISHDGDTAYAVAIAETLE